jgi:hypothetical protein
VAPAPRNTSLARETEGYRRPGGRASLANDIVHWQTSLRVADLDGAARGARSAGKGWISPGPVSVAGGELGRSRALLARDPDGHTVEFFTP